MYIFWGQCPNSSVLFCLPIGTKGKKKQVNGCGPVLIWELSFLRQEHCVCIHWAFKMIHMYLGRRPLLPVSALKLSTFLKQICFQPWQKPICSPSQHVGLVVSTLNTRCGKVSDWVCWITCWPERGCALKPEHRRCLVFAIGFSVRVTVKQRLSNVGDVKEASKGQTRNELVSQYSFPSQWNMCAFHMRQRQAL